MVNEKQDEELKNTLFWNTVFDWKGWSWIFKAFGYLWGVIVNLITLAVILIIFSNGNTKFESIIFSLLVLIYLTVSWHSEATASVQNENWHLNYRRFKYLQGGLTEILRTVDKEYDSMQKWQAEREADKGYKGKEEYEAEEYKSLEKKWRREKITFGINTIFTAIFYLITIINLLRVTVFLSY